MTHFASYGRFLLLTLFLCIYTYYSDTKLKLAEFLFKFGDQYQRKGEEVKVTSSVCAEEVYSSCYTPVVSASYRHGCSCQETSVWKVHAAVRQTGPVCVLTHVWNCVYIPYWCVCVHCLCVCVCQCKLGLFPKLKCSLWTVRWGRMRVSTGRKNFAFMPSNRAVHCMMSTSYWSLMKHI